MIERKQGNLLEADVEALVNTVNCVGVMGKGIALQFKRAYPENFKQYEKVCRAGQLQPGQMLVTNVGLFDNPKYIINFPTKRDWKQKSRLQDVQAGLISLVEEVKRLQVSSIALPPLGCGNGGLNWSEVAPLIEAAFEPLGHIRVMLFEPHGAPEAATMRVATKRQMTRARALLIKLIEQYGSLGDTLTLLEAMKLGYFIQEAGEPMRLEFVKGDFGPYANNINHLLQAMEGHYIQGYGDHSGRAEMRLLPDAVEEAEQFLVSDDEARERLARVAQLIDGFETPRSMELLATVHYVAREEPSVASDVQQAVTAVQEWSERKRHTFQPEHIRKAWLRLQEQSWFAALLESA